MNTEDKKQDSLGRHSQGGSPRRLSFDVKDLTRKVKNMNTKDQQYKSVREFISSISSARIG